ncbi:hypothetical protein XELAEV_18043202mg [Xenopus laevis]|uniref:Uncharacterized protein n=1 Tax=Xenopus laevis TaxID=8355 RepID=A0A974H266_XENLA|nr:hypothetical protein XELAEV_18043202mg [Xenopus laevis]
MCISALSSPMFVPQKNMHEPYASVLLHWDNGSAGAGQYSILSNQSFGHPMSYCLCFSASEAFALEPLPWFLCSIDLLQFLGDGTHMIRCLAVPLYCSCSRYKCKDKVCSKQQLSISLQ